MKENLYKYTNPHTRGILTNFDTQMMIWNHLMQPMIKENGGNAQNRAPRGARDIVRTKPYGLQFNP